MMMMVMDCDDVNVGMMDVVVGTTWMDLLVAIVALMTSLLFVYCLVDFYSAWLFYYGYGFIFATATKRTTSTTTSAIAVDRALFDNDGIDNDDDDDKSASMTMMRPKKFNYRVLYVIRRTNTLYWDHPLLCREEYQFASRILSPARFFVKAGRAMPAILEEEERVDSMEETIANDDDDELVEDMDWEPTRDVKIFFCDEDAPLRDDRGGVHFLPQLLTPGTSTTHVPRDEANEIVFAGRARSSIPEAGEAHFLQDPVHVSVAVTSTNIVPRDDADGVARGCRIHNSDCDCEIDAQGCDMIETKDGQIEIKIKTKTEMSLFLPSKRARRSIPEAEAHFLQVHVISTNIVPRDDNADGIGRGCQMVFSDNGNHDIQHENNDRIDVDASCEPQAFNDAEKKESPMPESSDDDDYFDFDIDDFPDFDDTTHDNEDDNGRMDVDASCEPQATNDDEKKESPMPDLSFDQGVRLQVPLRRSTRIAERREHQKLQISIGSAIDKHIASQETKETPTITNSIHSEKSSPNILGSIFMDGRRRSARKLSQHG